MNRICLYSEDRALAEVLRAALGEEYQIVIVRNAAQIDHLISKRECDLVLLDLHSGAQLACEQIQRVRSILNGPAPWVIVADETMRLAAEDLVSEGAFACCRRPPPVRDLKSILRRALERSVKCGESRLTLPEGCDRLIGASIQMQEVYRLIKCVADLNVSVLVTGQSGTGKELVARAIHNLGNRAGRPFVAVPCGAIPETLIEAELFGHDKGAYTGTVGTRAGFFEQAGEGTLFLDEIGELSLQTQVKLLRVLQEREFTRLGGSRLIRLRARMVFATNRNLAAMVRHGEFREDLFYRVNVVKIEAPALQDRAEDIPQIAMHFLRHYSRSYRKAVDTISSGAMDLLRRHSWPGNVRELENAIQRAIVLAEGNEIRMIDLPPNLRREQPETTDIPSQEQSFESQLHNFKIRLAKEAVRETRGNKTLAARSLRISRAYLHRLVRLAEPGASFDATNEGIAGD